MTRARELLISGKLDKAQQEITKALRECPDSALAIDIQGVIHMHAGRLDDAAAEFQKSIDLDPTIGQPYVGLGIILLSHQRFKEALVPLERASSILPTSWIVYYETAIAHLQLGDTDSTLKQISYAERLAHNPETRSATAYLRAIVSIKLQDYENAVENLRKTVELDPAGPYAEPAQARLEQVKSLLDAGNESLAENELQP